MGSDPSPVDWPNGSQTAAAKQTIHHKQQTMSLFDEMFGDHEKWFHYVGFWADKHHKIRLIRFSGQGKDFQANTQNLYRYCEHLKSLYPECRDVQPITHTDPGNTAGNIIDSDTFEYMDFCKQNNLMEVR